MKTFNDFTTASQGYTCLEDFTLTSGEWSEYEPGTKAIRVKTYNSNGNLVMRQYVLCDIDNVDEVLEDMQSVPSGYYTDTCHVTKK